MIVATDTDLTQRAASGDREAFGRVFEQSLPAVWAFACRRTGNRAASEMLTRRILCRAVDELGSYDGQVPFAAWLLAVARRVAAPASPRRTRPHGRRPAPTTRPG